MTAAAGLLLLAGCATNQPKIVAEVNNETIRDDVYNERVQAITSIPETLNTDAGGVTMVNMIRDLLTDQLAQKYHATPPDEYVRAATDYQIRMDPNTSGAVAANKLTRKDLERQKRFELEAFGIGTNGDKATEQDMDKAYAEYKDKPEFRVKASYVVRILQVPDEPTGRKAISELKQTGDFKAVAQKGLGMATVDATNAAKDQTLVADQIRPELRQALDKLKPNEITSDPVAITVANPQQPLNPQIVYAVAQLKSKEPERLLGKTEMRFFLAPIALQKTHADWKEHYRRELASFTSKSKIRIAVAKYEGLVDSYIRSMAAAENTMTHPPVGNPPAQPSAGQ